MGVEDFKDIKVVKNMKRRLFILLAIGYGLWAMGDEGTAQIVNSKSSNGTYMDDAYYWPTADTIVSAEPTYDRNAREFIFLEDTVQRPDTVRMRITEK